MDAHLELSPVAGSVARARRWVARIAPRVGGKGVDSTMVDTLTLLVSEVVTNAVVHAGTPCTLSVERCDGRLRVEVHDGTDRLPEAQEPRPLAEGGRGVGLVAILSDAHGSRLCDGGGKSCWFELAIPAPERSDRPVPKMGQMA